LGGKVIQPLTPLGTVHVIAGIPAVSLSDGSHAFHIRFKDDQNTWSSAMSQFFLKIPTGSSPDNNIIAYEYWFDTNHAGKTFQTVAPQSCIQLITNIQASSLTNGLHLFHIRFKDDRNSWSSVIKDTFNFTGPMVNRSISSHTVINGENTCIDALQILTVGGNGTGFIVQGGGIVNMVAGLKINFLPNTIVQPGGYLHAYISPGSPYCLPPSSEPEFKEDATPEVVLTKNSALVIYPNPTNGIFTE